MDNSPLIQVDEDSSSSLQVKKNKNFHSNSSSSSYSNQIGISSSGSDFDVNIKSTINNNSHSSRTVQSNRMSLLKALTRSTRRNSQQGKHKKFNDNWINGNRDPVLHGVTFYVKFLGSILTDKAGSEQASDATKTIIQMVKAGKKTRRVGLTVSSSGITLLDGEVNHVSSSKGSPDMSDNCVKTWISIYDIAHCSADANFPTSFSFIATNKNDTNECYCFASRSRKQSQQITLTIAEAFNLAFEIWQNSCGGEKDSEVILNNSSSSSGGGGSEKKIVPQQQKTKQHKNIINKNQSAWVHFSDEEDEDEELVNINDQLENINLRTLRTYNNISRRQESNQELLICLH